MSNYISKAETKEGAGRKGRIFQGECKKTRAEMLRKQESSFNKLRKKRKKKR